MKEIKKIIKDIISNTSNGVIDRLDGDLKHEGFAIVIRKGDPNPNDIHHEEVWDDDLDIKVWRYDSGGYPDDIYPCKYAIEVNGDKVKNYKDGKDIFNLMDKKYKAKKKELKKQKVSRILEKLDTFYTKK